MPQPGAHTGPQPQGWGSPDCRLPTNSYWESVGSGGAGREEAWPWCSRKRASCTAVPVPGCAWVPGHLVPPQAVSAEGNSGSAVTLGRVTRPVGRTLQNCLAVDSSLDRFSKAKG